MEILRAFGEVVDNIIHHINSTMCPKIFMWEKIS